MVRLRLSKFGLTLGVMFLLAAGALFAIHLRVSEANGGDAGDNALLFFLFTLPWPLVLPEWVVNSSWWSEASYYVSWLFVGVNAFLLYCLGGGVGLGRRGVMGDGRAANRDTRPDPHAVRDG